jgi:hypothetical protein
MSLTPELSDAQWCMLDLLMRAKSKGVSRVNRMELLRSEALPEMVRAKLVFTALTMSGGEYVTLHGQHDFEITPRGEEVFLSKYARPTSLADLVIALPDLSREVIQ